VRGIDGDVDDKVVELKSAARGDGLNEAARLFQIRVDKGIFRETIRFSGAAAGTLLRGARRARLRTDGTGGGIARAARFSASSAESLRALMSP